MKKIILALSTCLVVSNAYSQENLCEKLWQAERAKAIQIQKLKSQTCAFIWDDAKVVQLLKKLHLNPDNPQWMATDDCDVIQVGQQKYTLYKGYYKNDLSDLKIIRDSSNNLYGFFRDLGKYSFVDDAFKPTATANQYGVDLKCAALGNNLKLPNILIQHIFQSGIDLTRYSFDDNSK
ncbi:hypothetical protein A7P53_02145 [Acinetobacter defluvii]|uniref:hypothetical protein n=1 Tax=Acinetobacter defluvii TaxID=1871111 RepID=UPI00148FD761|nr:hypothetical protein [Acinetobacter defluvii]NNP74338.1 hypothetical protein [Acinetobacter defluvii]